MGAVCHGRVVKMSDDGEVGNDMALQQIGDDGGGVPWPGIKYE